MKAIITLMVFSILWMETFAQVSVNTTGTSPDASSMLDVTSTTKGVLVPRMTAAQREAISNPAKGLLIFCTDNNLYYYNMGTPASKNWVALGSQWLPNGTSIYYNSGNVGIGASAPVEKIEINGAAKIGNTASACDAAHAGTLKFIPGSTGIGDKVCICRKLANGVYSWDQLNFDGSYALSCDNFDRTNSTTVTGWTEQSGDWSVASNRLQSQASASSQYITNDGSSLTDGEVTCRVIYPSGAIIKAAGVVARYTSQTLNIMAKVQDNAGTSGYFDSYFIYNNGSIASYALGLNFGTDAIIQLSCNGPAIVFKIDTNRDGTYEYSFSTTVTNIDPGICGAFAYNQVNIDDWCFSETTQPANETCDYFDRAGSTTVTNWTENYGDWSVASYRLQSQALAASQYITYNGSTATDGCIAERLTYPSGSTVKAGGVIARFSSTVVNLTAKIQDNYGVGYFDSYFIYCNGSIITYAAGLNFGTDLDIQFSFLGTGVVLKIDTNRDGTFEYTYTGTVPNTSAGLCGAFAYQQVYLDNWCLSPGCP